MIKLIELSKKIQKTHQFDAQKKNRKYLKKKSKIVKEKCKKTKTCIRSLKLYYLILRALINKL